MYFDDMNLKDSLTKNENSFTIKQSSCCPKPERLSSVKHKE